MAKLQVFITAWQTRCKVASPENTFLWLEDAEKFIKRRVSLAELAVMVAEQITSKRGADKSASNKTTAKEQDNAAG